MDGMASVAGGHLVALDDAYRATTWAGSISVMRQDERNSRISLGITSRPTGLQCGLTVVDFLSCSDV